MLLDYLEIDNDIDKSLKMNKYKYWYKIRDFLVDTKTWTMVFCKIFKNENWKDFKCCIYRNNELLNTIELDTWSYIDNINLISNDIFYNIYNGKIKYWFRMLEMMYIKWNKII